MVVDLSFGRDDDLDGHPMNKLIFGALFPLLCSGCLQATDEAPLWGALMDGGERAVDGGAPDAGSDPSAGIFACDSSPPCGSVEWCWQDARPGQARLNAIWAAPGGEAWIAGDEGLLIRYDGERFTRVDSGTTEDLRELAGSAPDDVWAAGSGETLLRWNGASWQPQDAPVGVELTALFSPTRDSLWAGGSKGGRGVLLRWANGAWTQQLDVDAPLADLAGVGHGMLVAAEDGEALYFDGKQFSSAGRRSVGIRALWSARADLAFAAGGGTTATGEQESLIARWSGRHWSEDLHGLGQLLRGLHGATPDDAWAVGTAGTVLRFDGTRWTSVPSGITAELNAVWSFGPEHAVAVGAGGAIGVLKRTGCNP